MIFTPRTFPSIADQVSPGNVVVMPNGMMAMADKALKAAGYQNGMADLQAMRAKYMSK